jgi:hypothetical protein
MSACGFPHSYRKLIAKDKLKKAYIANNNIKISSMGVAVTEFLNFINMVARSQ